jgi:hypothetical protein
MQTTFETRIKNMENAGEGVKWTVKNLAESPSRIH